MTYTLNRSAFAENVLWHMTQHHGIASQPVKFCESSEMD